MVEVAVDGASWRVSAAAAWAGAHWERALKRWLRPYLAALPRARQRHWAPAYVAGLLGPSARKSIEPMAALVADGDYDQLHHFVTTRAWAAAPLHDVLIRQATRQLGGPSACLIIDDTTLLKKGTHSVGVSQQYSGAVGKLTNCQTLVTLTLARGEVPIPVAMRLFLPACWADDPRRCARAGVPRGARVHQEKWHLALEELDRVRAAGGKFGRVLADAAYDTCAAFRQALSARGLQWAVGIRTHVQLYPVSVRLSWQRARGGRRQHPRPLTKPRLVRAMAERLVWHRLAWRTGTKGRLMAAFRRPSCARGRWAGKSRGMEDPRRTALAHWRAARRRARAILSEQSAGDGVAAGACPGGQGALGVRAGASAAQGRGRSGPLRGPELDWPAAPRAAHNARLRLSAAVASEGGGRRSRGPAEWGENQSPARRPTRAQSPRDSARAPRRDARPTPRRSVAPTAAAPSTIPSHM